MSVPTGTLIEAGIAGTWSRKLRNFQPVHLVWLLVSGSIVGMIVLPAGYLVISAFSSPEGFTAQKFISTLANPRTISAFVNTIVYVFGVSLLGVVIGVLMAFLVERTNISSRSKRIIRLSVIASVITPGFLTAMAYVNLLGPNAGLVNIALRGMLDLDIARGPLNVFTLPGVLLLGAHTHIAYVYLITAASFSKMNPELEEAAAIAGAGRSAIARTVTLPLVRNAILAGGLVSMLGALADYGTPHMVGYTVLTLRIREYIVDGDFPAAASVSLLLIVMSMIVLAIYRVCVRGDFTTVTGKSFHPKAFDIGWMKHVLNAVVWLFAILAVILPVAGLVVTSLLDRLGEGVVLSNFTLRHYRTILIDDPLTFHAFWNSIRLATGAALITSLMAIVVGYITVRRRTVASAVLDYISVIPLGLAGTALGVALIVTVLTPPFRSLHIYGTLWILLIAYVIRNFPLALRPVQTTLSQISPEIEEAARMAGAGWIRTTQTILLPLIFPGVVAGFVLVFLNGLTEISASIVLRHIGTHTISTAILDIWDGRGGGYQAASAVAIVLFALMIGVVALAQMLTRRRTFKSKSAIGEGL